MNLLANTASLAVVSTLKELVESSTEMIGVLITSRVTLAQAISENLALNSTFAAAIENNANCVLATVAMATPKLERFKQLMTGVFGEPTVRILASLTTLEIITQIALLKFLFAV